MYVCVCARACVCVCVLDSPGVAEPHALEKGADLLQGPPPGGAPELLRVSVFHRRSSLPGSVHPHFTTLAGRSQEAGDGRTARSAKPGEIFMRRA